MSILDLSKCETILKEKYNINENDSLIFIKNEKKKSKASEKQINFDVYEPYNKTKLNLSFCEGSPINIIIPAELSEETKQLYEKMKDSGYDMFNINDPFYQDICIPFDSDDGTDILLSDRVNYIYNNDDTQCQSNCKLSFYSIESGYLNCSCEANEEPNNDNNNKIEKFSAKKIYESFYDVLRYSNYKIIKCFNLISKQTVITSNIGSIIVIVYFSIYLSCLFIFIFKGISPLKIKIINYYDKSNENDSFKLKNIKNILYPPKKIGPIRKLVLRSDILRIKQNEKKKKANNHITQNKNGIINNIQIFSGYNSSNNGLNNLNISPDDKINKINIIKNKKETENEVKEEYDDYELNELEYIEAIKYDKRTLLQIYWATLKREHLIIFTFINCNDYNLLYIKLSRFIFLLVGDMALNVFFFSDDSMHKLFLNYGKYDFFQQIPQIVYSTIISQLIEVFLCFLSLTDKHIYQIKSVLRAANTNKIIKIIKCVYIKLISFYVFTFIFFALYWYIISVFCGVYRNTQIHFIKDSIISFSICLAYPFLLYFVSASLRIFSLKYPKRKLKCIYNLSSMIPFF